jgi:hypothetical protein
MSLPTLHRLSQLPNAISAPILQNHKKLRSVRFRCPRRTGLDTVTFADLEGERSSAGDPVLNVMCETLYRTRGLKCIGLKA